MARRNARNAGQRSHAPKSARTRERRQDIVDLLGDGLARVIERSSLQPTELCDSPALSDSSVTRVEMPGHAGLSVIEGVGSASETCQSGGA
ncbi:MAG: hypothetical protein KF757_14065 [Phycisphaeraceae bacterium]|nr:hypothetical protein [Phycisphaeraceae bacterium]